MNSGDKLFKWMVLWLNQLARWTFWPASTKWASSSRVKCWWLIWRTLTGNPSWHLAPASVWEGVKDNPWFQTSYFWPTKSDLKWFIHSATNYETVNQHKPYNYIQNQPSFAQVFFHLASLALFAYVLAPKNVRYVGSLGRRRAPSSPTAGVAPATPPSSRGSWAFRPS